VGSPHVFTSKSLQTIFNYDSQSFSKYTLLSSLIEITDNRKVEKVFLYMIGDSTH